MYMTLDASYELLDGQVQRARRQPERLVRRLERLVYSPRQRGLRWLLTKRLRLLRRKLVGQ